MANFSSTCLSGAQPVKLNTNGSCNLGFFCPNSNKESPPTYCPPTRECLEHRLQNLDNICLPQGTHEPIICAPGYYCSPGGKKVKRCPAGHFCPLGSVKPIPCGRTSICPRGAQKEIVMDGFIAVIIIDLMLLVLMIRPTKSWLYHLRDNIRSALPNSLLVPRKLKSSPEEICESQLGFAEEEYTSDKDNNSLTQFVASVKRCIGSNEVGMSVGFKDLSYHLNTGKVIVAPQTGHIEKGSLWAVMGSSGAGKTSFVNLIMGKVHQTGGEIYVNRVPCNMSRFRTLIGYVPQDDVLMADLTVRENIMHSARVRLPSSWSSKEVTAHVDTLISCLGLSHVENNRVGDPVQSYISGGQRKRVSIGLELVAAPMAIFLDEPTSGLDSTAALSIIRLLKTLSQLGVTIICIIHQPRPEILEILDGIHLLGRGRQLYHGKASFVANHFEKMGFDISNRSNIADAVLDIISDNSTILDRTGRKVDVNCMADQWSSQSPSHFDVFREKGHMDSREQLKVLSQSSAIRGASWLTQVRICLYRSIKQQWRQKKSFILEIGVGAIAGLLIGMSLYPANGIHFQGIYHAPFQLLSSAVNYTLVPQMGLFCCLSITITNIFSRGLAAAAPAVKTFGEEKQIYWREASSGHSRSAYYIGKVMSTLPRISISALHYTTFFFVLATPRMYFWKIFLTNILYFYCIYGLSSMMSMSVRREDGPLMAMLLSLVVSVFSGYGPSLISVNSWHLEWFWRLSPAIWYTEAFYDQFLKPLGYLYDLRAAVVSTGVIRERFRLDLLFMFFFGSVYRVIAYFGLIFLDRDKQR
ncbi:ATP-binding cassette sub-family G member 2 [Golovinomyces cichoracearum]|uniref:ATP-binding cassette sub-family G member 2 n=1 Tax=Golovinomyces cichoracearum TaxID=62708 RepID=A0A420IMJ1_9PEZI|nr:ATP-binding cassette sub-family G member 2 [Golovinomyces cichoracearum]